MRTARVRHRRRRHRRAKSNPAPRRNPAGGIVDTAVQIGAGFAGFAVTRAVSKITSAAVARKWPRAAKLAGIVASAGSVVAAHCIAPRVEYTRDYAESLTMGAGVATAATLLQTLFPKYGWLLGLETEASQAAALPAAVVPDMLPQGDAETWYYNDGMDAGRYAAPSPIRPEPGIPSTGAQPPPEPSLDDLMSQMTAEDAEIQNSIFGTSN